MKLIFLYSLLFQFFISICFAQNKINIAVLDLDGEGVTESEARIISSRLRTNLFNTNKFSVIERDAMDQILKEQGFQQSGCTTSECAVEVGKLLGVRLIVAGEIGKLTDLYALSIRLIDVESGKILRTATEDCECSIKEVLTESVKKVSEILSGEKVQEVSYQENSLDAESKFTRPFGFNITPFAAHDFSTNNQIVFSAKIQYQFLNGFNLGFMYFFPKKENEFESTDLNGQPIATKANVNQNFTLLEIGYSFYKDSFKFAPSVALGYGISETKIAIANQVKEDTGFTFGINAIIEYIFTEHFSVNLNQLLILKKVGYDYSPTYAGFSLYF